MGRRGGRKTGGRVKGSLNRSHRPAFANQYRHGGQLPLDYMLNVMRDPKASDVRRDDMAKAAAPYLHPRRVPEAGDESKPGGTIVLSVNVDPCARPQE